MIITIQYERCKTVSMHFVRIKSFNSQRVTHCRNLYGFHWEKIYALAKARASHPRTTATTDPTGSSRLFTDPEEEREGKRSQFYSCRP